MTLPQIGEEFPGDPCPICGEPKTIKTVKATRRKRHPIQWTVFLSHKCEECGWTDQSQEDYNGTPENDS